MGRVRVLEERDIPHVVGLHRRIYPVPGGAANAPLNGEYAYFKEIFLDTPWAADDQPSLVYEDDSGTPIGFLGVMPRRMVLHGRPVRAAITAHFIVDPARRATLAGIELIKALVAGPQDLVLNDLANSTSRKIWEGLGGMTALLYSLYWVRVLRPTEYAMTRWSRQRREGIGAWVPLSRAVDAIVTRAVRSFRARIPATSGEELDGDTLARCVAEFTRNRALRPEYDGRAAAWLLEMARKPAPGTLRKVLVRSARGEIDGWYLYCGLRGGMGDVLQVGAREGRIGGVLDHLFAQAQRDGMVALMGQIDPQVMDVYSARHCVFRNWGGWTLFHTRNAELMQAIQRGDAFLTRLEGKWCAGFLGG